MTLCDTPDCDREPTARGLCHKHYQRWRRQQMQATVEHKQAWSRTLADGRVVIHRPHWPNVKFMSNIREQDDGCWIWTAGVIPSSTGGVYGTMRYAGRGQRAHRVAWQLFRGPIPDGLEIDHLCEVKLCVNPLHLEPVTRAENVRRASRGVAAVNRAKTHCPHGHEYTPENTLAHGGGRRCRRCVIEQSREQRRRKKELLCAERATHPIHQFQDDEGTDQ